MRNEKKAFKVLFVSSSGKVFKLIPFINSQHQSLQQYIQKVDHYRVNGSGIRAYRTAFRELRHILKNNSYDIVHSHWTYSGIICSLLVRKEKLIISFMGNDLQGIYQTKFNLLTPKGLINILLSQYLLFKVNSAIVKSKKMLKWVPFYFRSKTYIIPNGINLDRFKTIDQRAARQYLNLNLNHRFILFLGDKSDLNKNFKLLQIALVRLDEQKVAYALLTPYPTDSVQIPYYLAAANVLAFPSKLEGSPNVIKEALAMNCPIVATDVGDIAERISKIAGCYITTFDEYDFAAKLKAALDFNKRINSVDQIKEISEDVIAARILELYEKTIKSV